MVPSFESFLFFPVDFRVENEGLVDVETFPLKLANIDVNSILK